jgi:putative transcriptional regulator
MTHHPPAHHLLDEIVLQMAAGTAHEALHLLGSCHLTRCPRCRELLRDAESLGGHALASELGSALPDSMLDAVLARLDEPPPAAPAQPPEDPSGVLPRPLLRRLGPLDQVRWRWLAPGVHGVDVPVPQMAELPMRLIRLKGASRVPRHDHKGDERALILQGGWGDHSGHFERGDAYFMDRSCKDHRQYIDSGQDCIALVLNDAAVIPLGILGLFAPFFNV